jgi:allantoin racemase
MKLKIIVPIVTSKYNDLIREEVAAVLAPDAKIDLVNIPRGTDAIESRFDEFQNAPGIIELSLQAKSEGFDAIFVDCFGDPSVDAVRELVNIPVLGGFTPSILMAKSVAQRYSIVTILPNIVPLLVDLERKAGVCAEVVSNRAVDISVKNLSNHDKLLTALFEQSKAAVHEGAQAIILGCTGMLGVAGELQTMLAKKKMPVPVIDPTQCAITILESMVRMKLSHSRLAYYPVTP